MIKYTMISTVCILIFSGCTPSKNIEKEVNNQLEIETSCLVNESISQRKESIIIGDLTREFSITVPKNISGKKMPIIIAFHGGNDGYFYFPQQALFENISLRENVIIIYPQAKQYLSNEGAWQLNTQKNNMQDLNFVDNLIDYAVEEYCGNRNQTYAIGYSLGSMFTYELACHMSNKFVSIASYAGSMPINPNSCDVDESINIMHIHGKNDMIIPYYDSWEWKNWDSVGSMMDTESLIEFWGNKNSCLSKSTTNSDEYSEITYSDCKDNTKVKLFALNKVGHDWPEEINSTSTNEFIWNFLIEN